MDVKARSGEGLKAGRGVVITGLLDKIMAASGRLSPTPVTLRIANWMMSTREVRSNRSPSITAAA